MRCGPTQLPLSLGEDFDSEMLWATICTSRDAKFLMTVSTSSGKARSEEDGRKRKDEGCSPPHATMIIDVIDIIDGFTRFSR